MRNFARLEGACAERRERHADVTDIVPVVGARARKQLGESLAAVDVRLTADEVARIEREVPASAIAGSRYQDAQMKHLDSERS